MNKKQMNVVWAVLSILFALSLFPMRETTDGHALKRGFAYTQKIQIPENGAALYSKIDAETTIFQMLPVVIMGVALILGFGDKIRS
jgi:hypothetical protein